MRVGVTPLTTNEHLLLVVDKASKFSSAFPLPLKQAEGVARELLYLCLTFRVPRVIQCDGGRKVFGAIAIQHLFRWLKARIQSDPTDHPRAQTNVERLVGWVQNVLSESCSAWPERWYHYASPASWVNRTLLDPSLPTSVSPFKILLGHKPRTTLHTLVSLMDDSEQSGRLDAFVE